MAPARPVVVRNSRREVTSRISGRGGGAVRQMRVAHLVCAEEGDLQCDADAARDAERLYVSWR